MSGQVATSSSGLGELPAIVDLARHYKLTPQAFAYTFRAVSMPAQHSEAEFVSCVLVAAEHGLNPLTKEIYFFRTKSGQIQPIVAVDGWIRKCNEHPQFDGMQFRDAHDDKGNIISTTCIIHRKDRNYPIETTEYLEECLRVGGPVWKTNPRRMLRNRSLTQCARYAFGFAGVMELDEYLQWQAVESASAKPIKAAAIDVPVIPDIPDIPPPAEPAIVPDVEMIPPDGSKVLASLRKALKKAKDDASRMEAWEAHAEAIGALSDADQQTAEDIFEGRK